MMKRLAVVTLAFICFFLGGLVFSKIKVNEQLDILQQTCDQGASFELNETAYFCFPAELLPQEPAGNIESQNYSQGEDTLLVQSVTA